MSSKPEKSSLETSGKKLRGEPQMLQCFLVHLLKSGLILQHALPVSSSEKPALPKLPCHSAIHAPVTGSGGAQQRPDRPNAPPCIPGRQGLLQRALLLVRCFLTGSRPLDVPSGVFLSDISFLRYNVWRPEPF